MPSIEYNKKRWGNDYAWQEDGDEWSSGWGSVDTHWHYGIRPRLHRYLPADTILEIAPGFGRWTHYLKDHCRKLYAVDLTQRCIDACRQRFASCRHIEYFVNDGKSLRMIPDGVIDLAFSFDSLVHAEADVLESYVSQLSSKLKPGGVAVLHHSNLGAFRLHYQLRRWLRGTGGLLWLYKAMVRLRALEKTDSDRAGSMTSVKMRSAAQQAGLAVLGQELLNWDTRRHIDCISVLMKSDHRQPVAPAAFRNDYMGEMKRARRLGEIYARDNSRRRETD